MSFWKRSTRREEATRSADVGQVQPARASARRHCGLHTVGGTDEVVERFYAISVERRVRHPAVAAICEAARRELFAVEPPR